MFNAIMSLAIQPHERNHLNSSIPVLLIGPSRSQSIDLPLPMLEWHNTQLTMAYFIEEENTWSHCPRLPKRSSDIAFAVADIAGIDVGADTNISIQAFDCKTSTNA
jgi:hypothetical protein